MLFGVDINFHITAVYESGRDGEVNSKALSAEHVITHKHICFQSANQVQLVVHGCVVLTAFFVNTKNVNCCKNKVF